MTLLIGVAAVILLIALVHFGRRISDRIAYGPGGRPTTSTDAISAAHYDRMRGDSGPGGM